MNIIKNDPTLSLLSQIPEAIYDDSENFVLFLKAYYQWLQTSTFVLEDVVGAFSIGEIITGESTKASAIVRYVGDGYVVVSVTTDKSFNTRETVIGTSNASAILTSITDNVLRRSGNLLDYRSLLKSVDKFSDYLKDELYPNFPSSFYGDQRLITRKLKDYYQSKGQEESYRFLFKTLYSQNIDIIYPGEDILRVSDGDWVQSKILRAVVTDNIFDFLFKTIRGQVSGAVANVIDIKLVYIGTQQVAEMTLSLVSGTFSAGEIIIDIADPNTSTTLYGLITGFTINQSGTGYQVGDQLTITGDGQAVVATVSSIFESPIDSINVSSTGHGYRLNTYATVNNTGTGGSGLRIKVTGIANTYTVVNGANTYTVGEVSEVSIVNRGDNYFASPTITLTDETIRGLGLLSDKLIQITNSGNNYVVGDWITFTANTGAGANAVIASVAETTTYDLLFENGDRLQSETNFDIIKAENWSVTGPISRILMTNFGSGYDENNLPVLTINTSTGSNAVLTCIGVQGTGANVQVDSVNNTRGIGSIRSIEISDFGVNYTSANVDCTAIGDGNANITAVLSGIGINSGAFVTDDGKLDYKKIQDSYYYQDFSYVIRSGIEISRYRETLKTLIHPAGLEVFGEISIISDIDLRMASSSVVGIEAVGNFIKYLISQFEVKADYNSTKVEIDREPYVTQDILSYAASPRVIIVPKGAIAIESTVSIEPESVLNFSLNLSANTSLSIVPQDTPSYWGNQLISLLSSNTISEYSSIRFNTLYNPTAYDAVEMESKITGTVSVYANTTIFGSGTSFTTDFANNDYLIVGSDKFVVDNVIDNFTLQIKVAPQTTYVSQNAYKVIV